MTIFEKAERRPLIALALLAFLMFVPGLFTLPPVDRDEARFAQASRQMVETGNLVDIRFQGEPRHKKPVGIYWLQASFAKILGKDHIWPYRLPSFFGAIAAVLLTFWAGRPLVGARAALIGAALLAATLLLNVEARLAKTDAVLLATVVASMGVLARAWTGETITLRLALVFWGALGLGILVKGPIAPMVVALTVVALGLTSVRWAYLKSLRPLLGLGVLAVLVAPWVIAVSIATHGEFFMTAIAGDLAPKLAGGQESHGAPPGTYLALLLVTFWPGVIFLGPAFVEAYQGRKSPNAAFLMFWALPTWLVFEFIPTKLPHYVLPVYPALALMCGAWIAARTTEFRKVPLIGWGALLNFVVVAVALGVAMMLVRPISEGTRSIFDAAGTLTLFLVTAATARALVQKKILHVVQGAALAAFVAMVGAFGIVLPSLTSPFISPRIAALVPRDSEGGMRPVIASGYSEPSLVFLTHTDTRFVQPAEAAAILKAEPRTVAAIAATADGDFQAAVQADGLKLAPLGTVQGFNYSVGKPVTVTLFERADAQ